MGSLVKPFIYLTALETGRYNAATVVQDAPVSIKLVEWHSVAARELHEADLRPGAGGAGAGGVVESRHCWRRDGRRACRKSRETLQRFGLERAPAQVPSMLLGAIDVTPMEVAQMYNGLGQWRIPQPLRAVRAVISADSKPLNAFPLEVTPVASPEVVYEVDRMMEQVMEKGTGRGARACCRRISSSPASPARHPTITTTGSRASPAAHMAVVWVGYDDNLPTGFTGSSGALPVWARLMAGLGTTSWNAPMPESLAETWIDYGSGLRVDKDVRIRMRCPSRCRWAPSCR